jgi:hypothetical protein
MCFVIYHQNPLRGLDVFHRWIFDALPYLARQLSVFYRLPTEGYTLGGKFRLGDAEIRNLKV